MGFSPFDYISCMTANALRAATSTLVAVAGAGATITLLNRADTPGVDWSDLSQWLNDTSAEDVLVALVRLLALGVAWWLLASTTLYVAATALRLPLLVRCAGWTTLPVLRRVVDGVVAGSIVAGSTVGTGMAALAQTPAAEPAPAYVPRPAGDGPTYLPTPAGDGPTYVPTPAGDSAPDAPVSLPAPAAAHTTPVVPARPRPAAPDAPPTAHRVERGQHLWGIARAHLAAASGRPAADLHPAEVAPYWRRLIDANASRLRSGDPDLIHPGEELVLPEIDQRR